MTRKLPNTNEVIAQVKAEAARQIFEKQASAPPEVSKYGTGVGSALNKLASLLRNADLSRVTYEEVRQFADAMRTT